MINRDEYLNNLKKFKDKDLIKVITGIRRCGKSTLLNEFLLFLKDSGIKEKNIIKINLEDPNFLFENYKELYDYIINFVTNDDKYYIIIDEVQICPNFEKAINGLYLNKNIDIYITGSNAFLLSGELATLLSGRYIEIKMMPLSFKEYIRAFDDTNFRNLYFKYTKNGSFPYTINLDTKEEIDIYLDGIFNSIIIKDITSRKPNIDISSLKIFIDFIFDNIGNIFSSTKIANTMNSCNKKITVPTIENYLTYLIDSFILYKVSRYDIKGKQYINSGNKYYVSDIGIRNYLLGDKNFDRGYILENLVFLELIRRGNKVFVGKIDDIEVDFIAIKNGEIKYYQVSYTVEDKNTLDRELNSLKKINDNYEKILLTMDESPVVSHDGIKQIYVLDWFVE